jgi:hypothetical protein
MAPEGLKAGSKMKSRNEFPDSVSESLLPGGRLALCGSRRYITSEFPHIAPPARRPRRGADLPDFTRFL